MKTKFSFILLWKHASITKACWNVYCINDLHILSTTEYLFPSLGISRMISSEKNIGWRYCQDFCVLHHNSIISWARKSYYFHPLTSFKRKATKGELAMLVILVISSSNLSRIGSTDLSTYVSVSLKDNKSKRIFFHSLFILFMLLSNELYLEAVSEISLISSFESMAPLSRRL